MKIEGVCYLILETSSKFATDNFYVANTKAKSFLTNSCAIALNLLRLKTEASKSYQKQKHQSKISFNQNITKQDINQKHQKYQVNVKTV